MRADVSKLREDYRQHGLHRADLAEDPIAQFDEWFHGWLAIEPYDAAAMTRRHGRRRRPARRPLRAVPGLRPAGLRLLHELHERQGRRSSRPTRGRRCASAGSTWPARCGCAGRSSDVDDASPTSTGPADLGGAGSAPGLRTRARSSPIAPSSTGTCRREERFGERGRAPPGLLGRLSGSCTRRSSSGRARPTACTTGSATAATTGVPPAGTSTACPPDPRATRGPFGRRRWGVGQRWGATSAAMSRRWSRSCEVEDLEVEPRSTPTSRNGPEPGDDLAGRAGHAVAPQLVGLAADRRGRGARPRPRRHRTQTTCAAE